MKRLWTIISLATLLVVLSGCTVIVDVVPPIIYDATFRTDFQAEDGTFYICDTRDTLMTYNFRFSSGLVSWRQHLLGDTHNRIGYDRILDFGSERVSVDQATSRVTYSFIITSGTAPFSVDTQAVAPQAIYVEVGSAQLVLEGRASDGTTRTLQSDPIPIRSATGPTCPAN